MRPPPGMPQKSKKSTAKQSSRKNGHNNTNNNVNKSDPTKSLSQRREQNQNNEINVVEVQKQELNGNIITLGEKRPTEQTESGLRQQEVIEVHLFLLSVKILLLFFLKDEPVFF